MIENYQTTHLVRGLLPIRKSMETLLRGIFAIDQRIAAWLDKHWNGAAE